MFEHPDAVAVKDSVKSDDFGLQARGFTERDEERIFDWLESNDKWDLIKMYLETQSNVDVREMLDDIHNCESENLPGYREDTVNYEGVIKEVHFDEEVDLDDEFLMEVVANTFKIDEGQMDWRDPQTLWIREAE